MEYGNNILVPFDMIYDIDIGIFKVVKTNFKNPLYVDTTILQMSDNNFKYLMLNMDTYDPLNILLKDNYKESSEGLLSDLLSTEYDKIVKLAESTNVLKLLAVYLKTSLVKITVLCSNQDEANIIRNTKLISGVNIIIEEDCSKVNMEQYDSVFIKKYIDILKFKHIEGKSIFIGNYKFNRDKSSTDEKILPLKEISILVGDTNRLYFIDLYNIDDTYPIYG